ncbi:hypothetical protein [Hanstruepera flava]|uniref:hypothetical protein n=1 Tax=Hanstruepera flava TaxID=2930218 RepID=UPI0020297B16|nr:hypothetical protein [Hanstruepera flava]
MQFKNYPSIKFVPFTLISALLILTSCGSSQQVVQDSDGIYGSSGNDVTYVDVEQAPSEQYNPNSTFYKNYFNEKASEYDIYTEDEVFTDVDEYEGDYAEENDSLQVDYNNYAGWGQETSSVSINVYSGFGLGYAGYWNNYWGWNAGWGWGYPGWAWGPGWGYPGYGWGYYPPYYGCYYPTPYYSNGYRYSYVNGRRGVSSYRNGYSRTAYNNNYLNTRGRSRYLNTTTRRYTTSGRTRINSEGRPNNSLTNSNSTVKPRSGRTRTNTNSTSRPRSNYNGTTSRPRSNSSTRPRSQYNSSPRPRSSAPSRSYSSPRPSSGGGGFSRGGGGSSRGGRGGI